MPGEPPVLGAVERVEAVERVGMAGTDRPVTTGAASAGREAAETSGHSGASGDPGAGGGPGAARVAERAGTSPGAGGGWTAAYLRAREREGRLYPDATVAVLPDVPASDPLRSEWLERADSAARLLAAIARRPRPIEILEIGCGNGWLSNRLAQISGASVVGIDANAGELDQACRVFAVRSNLRFVLADARTATAPELAPDVIVLASMIQYVGDLGSLLRQLVGWLAPGGEIDLIDSPFYPTDEVPAAGERSRAYYASIGVPEMAASYHHHDWRELDGFAFEVRYRPESGRVRFERRVLGRPRSPFPWLVIRHEAAR